MGAMKNWKWLAARMAVIVLAGVLLLAIMSTGAAAMSRIPRKQAVPESQGGNQRLADRSERHQYVVQGHGSDAIPTQKLF